MKRIIPLALVFLALTSCKKDRTCECTDTYTSSNGNNTNTSVSVNTTVIKKSSKRTAKDLCQKSTEVSTGANSTSTDVNDCKLK